MIKKFGYAGITSLNDRQMQACFANMESVEKKKAKDRGRSCYFKREDSCYSVIQMLTVAFLICPHADEATQCEEFWLLVNPTMEDFAIARIVLPILASMIDIAVDSAYALLELSSEQMMTPYFKAQTDCSRRYIDQVRRSKQTFADLILPLVPEKFTFEEFEVFFVQRLKKVFFTSTALRLAISSKNPSRSGKRLAQSYAMITLFEFMSDRDKIKN